MNEKACTMVEAENLEVEYEEALLRLEQEQPAKNSFDYSPYVDESRE